MKQLPWTIHTRIALQTIITMTNNLTDIKKLDLNSWICTSISFYENMILFITYPIGKPTQAPQPVI